MRASPALRLTAAAGTALLAGPMLAGPTAAAELPTIRATYTVGANPLALAIASDGRRVATANFDSGTSSIIDVQQASVTEVSVGQSPLALALSADGSTAYVPSWSFADPGTVAVIDLASASRTHTINVSTRPGSIAVTRDGTTLLVASYLNNGQRFVNEVARFELPGRTPLATWSISGPSAIYPAPRGSALLISSIGTVAAGQVHVGTARAAGVTGVQLPGWQPQDAAFSPDGATAYVVTEQLVSLTPNNLAVIDVAAATLLRTLTLPAVPTAVAVSPDGSRVFVAVGSELAIFDASGSPLSTTPIPGTADLLSVSPAGYVLVTTTQGDLHVLDATGTQLLTTLAVGGQATDLEVAASGSFAALSVGTTNRVIIVNLPPVPASGAEVPTTALQQYARTDGSPCGTNAPDAIDFPGIAQLRTEGWSSSWAQWPNEGRGGAVCTRQPYYTSTGTWAVR